MRALPVFFYTFNEGGYVRLNIVLDTNGDGAICRKIRKAL